MRLINTRTLELEEFVGRNIPPYAILSHTWEDGEVSFQDMGRESRVQMKGFAKIQHTCSMAARRGVKYAWVDTCCIDKSSSAELTESINSMFKWYERAKICFAWLSDLGASANVDSALKGCRWFTRGWTLQELVASKLMEFYDRDWNFVGNKWELLQQLSDATAIDDSVLWGVRSLQQVSVCEKMSWAAERETTRVEDMAYCLLGIFDINMPLLYGEEEKAFTRLQEEIIRTTPDLSILAWTSERKATSSVRIGPRVFSSVLAESPRDFLSWRQLDINRSKLAFGARTECSTSNSGIKISDCLYHQLLPRRGGGRLVLPVIHGASTRAVGVCLKKTMGGSLVREDPVSLASFTTDQFSTFRHDLCLSTKAPKLHDIPTGSNLANYRRIRFRLPPNVVVADAWPWNHFMDEDYEFIVPQEYTVGAVLLNVESTADGPGFERRQWHCMFIFSRADGDAYTCRHPTISCSILDYDEFSTKLDRITASIPRKGGTNRQTRSSLSGSIPQTSTAAFGIPGTGRSAVMSFTLEEQMMSTPSGLRNPVLDVQFTLECYDSGTIAPAEDKRWADVFNLSYL